MDTATARLDATLAGYLLDRGWRRSRCATCGRRGFGKRPGPCGSPWCPASTGAPGGSAGRATAVPRTVAELWRRLRGSLAHQGHTAFALPDLGMAHDTDLVVSALQYLDPVVHDGAPVPSGPRVLAQPCVRWQFLSTAGREEGTSSSFVNLSSLEAGGPDLVERLPVHLDLWLNALSAVGVHARHLTIALTEDVCSYGPYTGVRADVNLAGLELGEINWYHRVDDATGRRLSVIDCGFAFERIAWAASRHASYHGMLAPVQLVGADRAGVINDRVRTLALLALFGITPGGRGPRRHARRLVGELAAPLLQGIDLHGCLAHTLGYWRQFVPAVPAGAALPRAIASIERQAVAELAGALEQPVPSAGLGYAQSVESLAVRCDGWDNVSRAVTALAVAQHAGEERPGPVLQSE